MARATGKLAHEIANRRRPHLCEPLEPRRLLTSLITVSPSDTGGSIELNADSPYSGDDVDNFESGLPYSDSLSAVSSSSSGFFSGTATADISTQVNGNSITISQSATTTGQDNYPASAEISSGVGFTVTQPVAYSCSTTGDSSSTREASSLASSAEANYDLWDNNGDMLFEGGTQDGVSTGDMSGSGILEPGITYSWRNGLYCYGNASAHFDLHVDFSPAFPQLGGQFTSPTPASATPGQVISTALQISADNSIPVMNGNEVTNYFLSTTPDLSGLVGGGSPLLVEDYDFDLASGASTIESGQMTIPQGLDPGPYYLIAQIDANGSIENQPGPIVSSPIQISYPQLGGQFTSPTPGDATPGQVIATSLRISADNAFPVMNGNEVTNYYLSTTPDLSGLVGGGSPLLVEDYDLDLAAGASTTESGQMTIPQDLNLNPGIYFLIAQIDANGSIEKQPGPIVSSPIVIGEQLAFDPDGEPSDMMFQYPSLYQAFKNPIVVDVEDPSGNIDTNDDSTVTLNLLDYNGNSVNDVSLNGTLSVQAVGGVAKVDDLQVLADDISSAGGDYVLQATDGNLAPVTSYPFTVTTLLTLASLSNDIYGNTTQDSGYLMLGGGYASDPDNVGFAAGAYGNDPNDPTQIVIAVRGTVIPPNWAGFIKNLAADVSFGGPIPSPALISEVSDTVSFVSSIAAEYPGAQITLTGHSLGGGVAQLIGRAANLPTYTFNAPGAGQLFVPLASLGEFDSVYGLGSGGSNVDYRLEDEQISLFGVPTGATVVLNNPIIYNPIVGSPAAVFAARDLVANGDTYINNIHAISTVITEIKLDLRPINQFADGASSITVPGEPNDAQEIENFINPLSSGSLTGLKVFAFSFEVTNIAALLDPDSGSDFLLAEQPGSPLISTVDLPVMDGINSYNVRYETDGTWSAYQNLQPGLALKFASPVQGVEFRPLDSNGQTTAITDSLLADIEFASTGTFTGSIVEAATPGINVWTGEQSADWNNAANWSNGAVPAAGTNAVIPAGNVIASSPFNLGSLTMLGGTLQLANNLGNGTFTLSSLAINGGILDLGDNELSIDYVAGSDPISSIASLVSSGFAGGIWNGSDIVSSTAAADPSHSTGIGYLDTGTQINIHLTEYGDANLDGTVNALDFNALATNYGKPGTFSQGDFNYSGTVDSNDFAILASRYGTILSAPAGSAMPANQRNAVAATSLSTQELNLFGNQSIDMDNSLLASSEA